MFWAMNVGLSRALVRQTVPIISRWRPFRPIEPWLSRKGGLRGQGLRGMVGCRHGQRPCLLAAMGFNATLTSRTTAGLTGERLAQLGQAIAEHATFARLDAGGPMASMPSFMDRGFVLRGVSSGSPSLCLAGNCRGIGLTFDPTLLDRRAERHRARG
jgi:hypothetical protein